MSQLVFSNLTKDDIFRACFFWLFLNEVNQVKSLEDVESNLEITVSVSISVYQYQCHYQYNNDAREQ